jgi:hypothetical protein
MSKESFVFTAGLLILIIPHLGLPTVWKTYFFLGVGALLVVVGYKLRRASYVRSIEKENGTRKAESFVEHAPKHTTTTHI